MANESVVLSELARFRRGIQSMVAYEKESVQLFDKLMDTTSQAAASRVQSVSPPPESTVSDFFGRNNPSIAAKLRRDSFGTRLDNDDDNAAGGRPTVKKSNQCPSRPTHSVKLLLENSRDQRKKTVDGIRTDEYNSLCQRSYKHWLGSFVNKTFYSIKPIVQRWLKKILRPGPVLFGARAATKTGLVLGDYYFHFYKGSYILMRCGSDKPKTKTSMKGLPSGMYLPKRDITVDEFQEIVKQLLKERSSK